MPENPSKKVKLNVLPDQQRLANVVQRAEAAGKERAGGETESEPGTLLPPADWPIERKLLFGKIIAALKTVYDPEIPVDIYELGLIYKIDITPENAVKIRMTLTAPACPVADMLLREVETKVESIPEVSDGSVELVWDPPWSKDRMSEAARMHLGF
jgi:FeS assembly SUF system protein